MSLKFWIIGRLPPSRTNAIGLLERPIQSALSLFSEARVRVKKIRFSLLLKNDLQLNRRWTKLS